MGGERKAQRAHDPHHGSELGIAVLTERLVEALAIHAGRLGQPRGRRARVGALGTQVRDRNPEQFAELVAAAYARYQRVVKQAGIRPE